MVREHIATDIQSSIAIDSFERICNVDSEDCFSEENESDSGAIISALTFALASTNLVEKLSRRKSMFNDVSFHLCIEGSFGSHILWNGHIEVTKSQADTRLISRTDSAGRNCIILSIVLDDENDVEMNAVKRMEHFPHVAGKLSDTQSGYCNEEVVTIDVEGS